MVYSLWLLQDLVVSSTSIAFIPLDTNVVYIKHLTNYQDICKYEFPMTATSVQQQLATGRQKLYTRNLEVLVIVAGNDDVVDLVTN